MDMYKYTVITNKILINCMYSLGSKVFVKNGGRHFHYRASLPISASLLTHKVELSLLLGTNIHKHMTDHVAVL